MDFFLNATNACRDNNSCLGGSFNPNLLFYLNGTDLSVETKDIWQITKHF
jgi:hypothetical protein